VLEWPDSKYAFEISRQLATFSRFRHFTVSVRVPRRALHSDDPRDASLLGGLASSALAFGMPGIIYLDNVIEQDPYGEVPEGINPCGEQHLGPDESCLLSSINLDAVFRGHETDWERFDEVSRHGARFLADALAASSFATRRSQARALARRRLGLGVTGFDTVANRFGMTADSASRVDFAHQIGERLARVMGRERHRLRRYDGAEGDEYRSLTSIAPAGSISRLAQVQAGISLSQETEITTTVEGRTVGVLAAFQRHIDNGISVTVPVAASTTTERVLSLWREAETVGCKGLTIFRRGTILPAFAG
jgi:ribonucleoside-diphosphate reductase alpha chain